MCGATSSLRVVLAHLRGYQRVATLWYCRKQMHTLAVTEIIERSILSTKPEIWSTLPDDAWKISRKYHLYIDDAEKRYSPEE